MTFEDVKKDWLKYVILISASLAIFIFAGCPPRTESLITSGKQITRPELQIELDTIVATAQVRMLDLDQQDELRAIVLQNALLLIEGGSLNPVGLVTAVAAIYGIGSVANSTKKAYDKSRSSSNNV